jgi:hypothetical protein
MVESGLAISPEQRERLKEMGVAKVRHYCSNGVFPDTWVGTPDSFREAAIEWLGERDEEAQVRSDAFQIKVARQSKSTLWAAWIAAIGTIIGLAATGYTFHLHDAEAARDAIIRDGLARYITSGDVIMNRFGSNEMPMPTMDEVGWVGITEDFLRTNLCESYVTRFHDNSGLAPIWANNADSAHNSQYAIMFHEIARLEEFSHERPSC